VQGQISRGFHDVNDVALHAGDEVTLDSSLDQALLCTAVWNTYLHNFPHPKAPKLTHAVLRERVAYLLEKSAKGVVICRDEKLSGNVLVQFRVGKTIFILVQIMADVLRKVGTASYD
jgi:hypothetical protein